MVSDSFQTPWTEAQEAPVSIRFPRQEYWNGLSFPSPRGLPDPGIRSVSPAWQVDSLPLTHQGSPRNFFRRLISIPATSFTVQINREKKAVSTLHFVSDPLPFIFFLSFLNLVFIAKYIMHR